MAKTLSRLIREYVGQHPGCVWDDMLCRVGDETGCALVISRLIAAGELISVNGRLYLSSVRTVSSPVCK